MLNARARRDTVISILPITKKQRSSIFIFHYYHFFSSMLPNEMAMYPNWLILYIKQIILPMVVMVIIALKILLKFGRDLQRWPEVWIIDPSFYNTLKSLISMEFFWWLYTPVYVAVPKQSTEYQYCNHTEVSLLVWPIK